MIMEVDMTIFRHFVQALRTRTGPDRRDLQSLSPQQLRDIGIEPDQSETIDGIMAAAQTTGRAKVRHEPDNRLFMTGLSDELLQMRLRMRQG